MSATGDSLVVGPKSSRGVRVKSRGGGRQPRGSVGPALMVALKSRRGQIGLVLTAVVCFIALFGPAFAPHNPLALLAPPYAPAGSNGLLFGADSLGRDVLSRFLDGGRQILIMSVIATLLGVGAGALLGLLAGYRRGLAGETVMRTMDVLLCFPPLVLALLFLSILGPKAWLIVLVVAATHLPRTARVIFSASLGVVKSSFVEYAEVVGTPRRQIVVRELLPNVVAPLTVEFGLRLCWSIGLIASLAYLGLGQQPPAPNWGTMINENQSAMTVQPWPVLLPVVAIALLTIGVNLLTDAFGQAAAGIDREIGVDSEEEPSDV